MISPVWTFLGGLLAPELLGGGKFLANKILSSRDARKKLEDALQSADTWLNSRLSEADRHAVSSFGAEEARLIATGALGLSNDPDGHELRCCIFAAIERADPFDQHPIDRKALADLIYESLLRGLVASRTEYAQQASALFTELLIERKRRELAKPLADLARVLATTQEATFQLRSVLTPSLVPPSPAEHRIARADLVSRLASECQSSKSVVIRGPSGSGKSQLALLLAERLNMQPLWVHLRGLDSVEAARHLTAATRLAMCGAAQQNIVVLDDLPFVQQDSPLSQALRELVQQARHSSACIALTTCQQLGQAVMQSIDAVEIELEPLADIEAAFLLEANGCPSDKVVKISRYCNLLARGNALLLAALARTLRTRQWPSDGAGTVALTTAPYEPDLVSNLLQGITATIPVPAARVLLYRLCLVIGDFGSEEIDALARIEPSVSSPVECFHLLVGAWVEQIRRERYRKAAILQALPRDVLNSSERKATFAALAEVLTSHRVLTPDMVTRLVGYWALAEEYLRAAVVLLQVLPEIHQRPELRRDATVLLAWGDMPFPPSIPISVRVVLCCYYIILRWRIRLSTEQKVRELESILDAVTAEDAWGLATGGLATIGELFEAAPNIATRILLQTVSLGANIRLPDGSEFAVAGSGPEVLLVLAGSYCRSTADMLIIATAVERLTPAQVEACRVHPLAPATVFALTEKLRFAASKNVDCRSLVDALARISEIARSAGWFELYYSGVHSRVIVMAEYLQLVPEARSALEAFDSRDALGEFLLWDASARVSLVAQEPEEAAQGFEHALRHDLPGWEIQWIAAAVDCGLVHPDRHAGAAWLKAGLMKAMQVSDYGDLRRLSIRGELIRQLWKGQQWLEACRELHEALIVVETHLDERAEWRGAAVLIWNLASYISEDSIVGRPPAGMFEPQAGWMHQDLEGLEALYNPQRRALALTAFCMLCDAAGLVEEARQWFDEAVRVEDELPWSPSAGPVTLMRLPVLIRQHRIEDTMAHVYALARGIEGESTHLAGALDLAALSIATAVAAEESSALAERWSSVLRAGGTKAHAAAVGNAAATLLSAYAAGRGAQEIMAAAPGPSTVTWLAGALLASLDDRLPYAHALGHQATVMIRAEGLFSVVTLSLQTSLVLFLEAFWTKRITRSRFLFRTPDLLAEDLRNWRQLRPELRLRTMVRAVGESLGGSFAPQILAWLNSASPDPQQEGFASGTHI